MQQFTRPNAPLNIPALEALEGMTGLPVPPDIREPILAASLSDDLSGLRALGYRFQGELDPWEGTLQPKRNIAEYVESHGIPTPKRFESLDDALHIVRSGGAIIARSEHPQEYADYSGLLSSYIVRQSDIAEGINLLNRCIADGLSEEDTLQRLRKEGVNTQFMQRYIAVTGQSSDVFARDISFSYHEYIPGRNITVVADDTIDGRYHITSYGLEGRGGAVGGIFNQAGEPFNNSDARIDSLSETASPAQIAELIATYEKVRLLPKFPDSQCPVMELQLGDDGRIWFLQYHKSRPFRPSREHINPDDYSPSEGWFPTQVVRGALGSFVTLKTALWYPEHYNSSKFISDTPEEGSFDYHFDIGFSEAVAPHRLAFFADSGRRQYQNMADGGHAPRSRWFRSFGALSLSRKDSEALLPEEKKMSLSNNVHHRGLMGRFVLDVASDGLVGFIRLNPDSEQPIISNLL